VKAVLAKVALGEADAGIVYTTDVGAAGDEVRGVEIPAAQNVVNEYPIGTVLDSDRSAAAELWIDFVRSDAGRRILRAHGFGS
jgi:molybdate transport system substrate-binding protein